MPGKIATLTPNQRLACLALALGVVAMGARVEPGPKVTLDVEELALLVHKEADHITPLELADWVIKEKADWRLVDLRTAQDYGAYHIPGAENVELALLGSAALPRNETLVLYSEGGIHAAQAWLLLKARGYPSVLSLKGGLDGWKDEVLFPEPPDRPGPKEAARLERLRAVSRFFGGQPRTAGHASSAVPMELPKVAPPPSVAAGKVPPKRGKKEGC